MKYSTVCVALFAVFTFNIISVACSAQTPVFYGMTSAGGSNNTINGGDGTIFSFNPANNTEKVVWNFDDTDGQFAIGNLVYDADKSLFYAMTNSGGTGGEGVLFSFNPTNDSESVIDNFDGYVSNAPGAAHGSFVQDTSNGLLYAMTGLGGTNTVGVIFAFNPVSNSENVVWNFGSVSGDGFFPYGDLTYDPVNKLFYGMTYDGGTDSGTIISFNPANNSENVVWNFVGSSDGKVPYGSLVYDANNGLFYGMTLQGGTNYNAGTIISFNPTNNSENVVWNFGVRANDGGVSFGDLIYDANNGLFYGMTAYGGNDTVDLGGTIFSFDPTDNSENVVWNFGSGNDGQDPWGNLIYDVGNGLFYGMTQYGGTNNDGTIFSFNPTNNSENVLWNFGNGTDGKNPYGSLVLYSGTTVINSINNPPSSINIYPNPNNGHFTVQLKNANEKTQIQIFNVLGETVYLSNLNSISTQINLSNHVAGIYLYRVLDEQGNQLNEGKFVIE